MAVAWSFSVANSAILDRTWPLSSFLFDPADRFADLTNLLMAQREGNPYGDSVIMIYFPFTNVLLRPLVDVSRELGAGLLLSMAAGVTGWMFFICSHGLRGLGERLVVSLTFVLSYPVVFAVDRGNLEILTYVLVAAFALCWSSGRRGFAAVALSGAIAMKATPVIFLAFLLPRRHWKHLTICLLLVLLETLAGLLILRPAMLTSLSSMLDNLSAYNDKYAVGDAGFAFGHSLFGGAKGFVTLILGDEQRRTFSAAAFPIFVVIAIFAHASALVYVLRRRPDFWRGLTVLTCVSLLFMPVSADYRLLLLLAPCALFLNDRALIRNDRLIAVLFGLAFVPKGFNFLVWESSSTVPMTLSTVLSPIVILALLITVVWSGQVRDGYGEAGGCCP